MMRDVKTRDVNARCANARDVNGNVSITRAPLTRRLDLEKERTKETIAVEFGYGYGLLVGNEIREIELPESLAIIRVSRGAKPYLLTVAETSRVFKFDYTRSNVLNLDDRDVDMNVKMELVAFCTKHNIACKNARWVVFARVK